jgi:hypothetical protein
MARALRDPFSGSFRSGAFCESSLHVPYGLLFHRPLNGHLIVRVASRSSLCWLLHSKLIFLMLLGHRMEAISILGREVMQPRGLIGLGHDSIDFCGLEIAQVSRGSILWFKTVYYSTSRPFENLHPKGGTPYSSTVLKAKIGLVYLWLWSYFS